MACRVPLDEKPRHMGAMRLNGVRHRLIESTAIGPRCYHWLYDAGVLRSTAVSVPVISVGAVTMGGAGKTPFVELVVERLCRWGRRPAVVSRGYRRRSRGVVMVARGEGPEVDVATAGDEPFLLARRTSAIVVVGADRAAAAEAATRAGANAVVLDDGFQHRRLHRDLDIVLVDAAGSGAFVVPFGLAREPPSAIRRADVVVRCAVPGLPDPPGDATPRVAVEALPLAGS